MSDYPKLHMIIDGEKVYAGSRRTYQVVNPATEEVIGELPLADAADLERALAAAARGFAKWRKTTAQERVAVLQGAARLMLERKEQIARISTLEQGKPLEQGRLEVMMVHNLWNFYAGEALRLYGRALVRPTGFRSTVRQEPVGPVAAFAPWNFPIGNPGRKLGPAVATGCSVILKAAEETPGCALAVLQCLLDAGLPPEVGQAVFGVPDEVSRHLLGSPVIRKLSFTGSTIVGKHLMKLAADDCKRTTMELGGHGPVLVFADMDIDQVVNAMVPPKVRNAGQVCISPTRFIVEEAAFSKFRDAYTARYAATKVGYGLDESVEMGPMANPRRPEAMDHMVADARARGAKLDTGGTRIGNQGYFYAPTVMSEVPLDALMMNEEPFGPLAIINPFPNEEAMIAEANRLPYGLAAYAWTNDYKRQQRVAGELEAGMVTVNTGVVAAPDAPFCGVKWSGHGHEDGPEGVQACLVTKVVHEG
ncbi:MAG: NAD-dependent succinate-semialdehyde dehydrogenase [Alphaproteobacteria bacterium]|nr:NAD-dependent succinate-semialdehyde dehydrogenase [Alphaproteobacteria bacterium]